MAIKPVKMFTSAMVGAPVLNGTAGSLIALLDACLVNGFNLVSLTSLSIVDGVLTGEKAGHGFIVDQVVATTANEPILNGEWIITSATSNTFSAAATGLANTNGSGAITAKSAAAGWEKIGAGNKAAYRSTAPESTQCWLMVDDSGTTTAQVVGYESMTDVDSGVGKFPTESQRPSGGVWYNAEASNVVPRNWVLIAGKSAFYFSREHSPLIRQLDGFGDFKSERPGDAYQCFLQVSNYTWTDRWGGCEFSMPGFQDSDYSKIYCPRSYTQIGSAVQLFCSYSGGNPLPSGRSSIFSYPSPANNGLLLAPVSMKEPFALRCLMMPGLFATPQNYPLTHGDIVGGVGPLIGRKLICLSTSVEGNEGRMFIDFIGPWY